MIGGLTTEGTGLVKPAVPPWQKVHCKQSKPTNFKRNGSARDIYLDIAADMFRKYYPIKTTTSKHCVG